MKVKRKYIPISIELNKDIPQIIPMGKCYGKCNISTYSAICF